MNKAKYYALLILNTIKEEYVLQELDLANHSGEPLRCQQETYPEAVGVMNEFEVGKLFGMHHMLQYDETIELTIFHTRTILTLSTASFRLRSLGSQGYGEVTKDKFIVAGATRTTILTVKYLPPYGPQDKIQNLA